MPDEVYKAIESCMSGGHARLLIMHNPRAEAGEPYRLERDGRANVVHLSAFNHPNVRAGQNEIPGAVTRETTVRRINQWCRPMAPGEEPDSECFELPAFLEGTTTEDQSGQQLPPLQPGQTFGSILQVHSPANEDLLNLRFVVQSVKKYSEHNKILHFGESVIPGKIQNLTDDVETKSIERFPGLSALGCVLLEMEFGRPESESLGGFVPKRSTNTRWFR